MYGVVMYDVCCLIHAKISQYPRLFVSVEGDFKNTFFMNQDSRVARPKRKPQKLSNFNVI